MLEFLETEMHLKPASKLKLPAQEFQETEKSYGHTIAVSCYQTPLKMIEETHVPLQYDPSRCAYNHNFHLQSLATIEPSTILRNIINMIKHIKHQNSNPA